MNRLLAQITAGPRIGRERAPRRLFVRDLVLDALIGVYEHEKTARQRIRVNLDLDIVDPPGPPTDRLADVVSYEDLVVAVRAIVAEGHVHLIETLAERIAARCLEDPRVLVVRVRVEKLDIFPDAQSAGIEIERFRG